MHDIHLDVQNRTRRLSTGMNYKHLQKETQREREIKQQECLNELAIHSLLKI